MTALLGKRGGEKGSRAGVGWEEGRPCKGRKRENPVRELDNLKNEDGHGKVMEHHKFANSHGILTNFACCLICSLTC